MKGGVYRMLTHIPSYNTTSYKIFTIKQSPFCCVFRPLAVISLLMTLYPTVNTGIKTLKMKQKIKKTASKKNGCKQKEQE